MLFREQFYLDVLFKNYPLSIMNNSPTAGTTPAGGYKHKPVRRIGLKRSGKLNPMSPRIGGKLFSPEFLLMQKMDKTGKNNPTLWDGLKKSAETLEKITKLVYVYSLRD